MDREVRNIDWCIYYRLFAIAVQRGWWYTRTDIPMTVPDVTAPTTYSVVNPYPLVFFNADLSLNPSGVIIYDGGVPVPSGNLTIDYINCLVTLNPPPSGVVTADLMMHTVKIVEGYPEPDELVLLNLPIIAYQIERNDSRPYAIGAGEMFRERYITIDFLARNDGERKDMMDDYARFMQVIPEIDLRTERPLNENFALNWSFSFADQYIGPMNIIGGIRGDLLRPRAGGSDKERFRALITFEVERVS